MKRLERKKAKGTERERGGKKETVHDGCVNLKWEEMLQGDSFKNARRTLNVLVQKLLCIRLLAVDVSDHIRYSIHEMIRKWSCERGRECRA